MTDHLGGGELGAMQKIRRVNVTPAGERRFGFQKAIAKN
jgi:hypothetical protein